MLKKLQQIPRLELLVFGLVAVMLLVKTFAVTRLTTDSMEFLGAYKFTSTDSYDWIANGLRLFENDSITYRNPGLPLLIKGLAAFDLMALVPFISNAMFFSLILYCYKLSKRLAGRLPAFVVVAGLTWNFTFNLAANYILADMYAIALISASLYYLVSRRYLSSLGLLGASILFQNIGYFLLPMWLVYIGLTHRQTLQVWWKKRQWRPAMKPLLLGIASFAPVILWNLYRLVKFGDPMYTKVDHLALLKPDADALLFYGINIFTMFGLIVLPVAVYFLFNLRKTTKNSPLALLLGGLIFNLIFWVVFYDWTDRRFLLYLAPFLYPLIAYYLAQVRRAHLVKFACCVLLLYPSSLPVLSFFTGDEIPLTTSRYIKLISDKQPGRLTLETQKRPDYRSTWAILHPATYLAVANSERYKSPGSSWYSFYTQYVGQNFDWEHNRICVDSSKNIKGYLVSSVLLINHNVDIDKVSFNDCPAKS